MATKEVNEQVKPIVIHDPDNNMDYTLEFNRDSIRFAEARRFDIDDVGRFPMTKVPELFYYAFRMHHMNISREKTDKIFFEGLGGFENLPAGFAERLGALYNVPFTSLEEGGKKGNPKMTVEL